MLAQSNAPGQVAPRTPSAQSESDEGESRAISPAATGTIRREFPSLAIGVLVIATGLASLLVFFVRRDVPDTLLAFFGLTCLLDGARVLLDSATAGLLFETNEVLMRHASATITYWLNFPIWLLVERMFGRGWRSSIRRLWKTWLVFALIATPVEWLLNHHDILMVVNNSLVTGSFAVVAANFNRARVTLDARVLRVLTVGFVTLGLFVLNVNLSGLVFLPWGSGREEIGFVILIGCLGYVVAHRQFQNERQLVSIEQELHAARQIQTSILPREPPAVRGMSIAAHYVPMTAVGGDFYDFLQVDDRRVGILVADVSGHGVPAALIASMVKVGIAAQSHHADQPSQVLSAMNRMLCGKLERQFVTASHVYIDLDAGRLVGASAGHPPTLLWNAANQRVVEVDSSGIMLGHFVDAVYETVTLEIGHGDRLLMYTDGIIETTNRAGEFFDPERLQTFLADRHTLGSQQLSAALLEHLSVWSGRDPASLGVRGRPHPGRRGPQVNRRTWDTGHAPHARGKRKRSSSRRGVRPRAMIRSLASRMD